MADATAAALLPKQSSTPFELAHLGAMVEAWPIDVDAVRRESDPMLCSIANLPFLAFDRGLTLWSDDWPEARKRAAVRDAWIYKRLEGTPLGAEVYLNLADGMLIDEALPPDDAFLIDDDGLTHQEILDRMPQLRLFYHWPETKPSSDYLFIGRDCLGGAGSLIPDQTGALGRYPVLYDPATGVATPLVVNDLRQTALSVSLKGRDFAGSGLFVGGPSFFGRDAIGEAFVSSPLTFDLADPALTTSRNSPPMRSAQDAVGRSFIGRTCLTDDIGDVGTYDRLYLYANDRIPSGINGVRSAMFLGASWFSIPAYHQILTIAIAGNPLAVPPLWGFAGQGFLIDAKAHPQLDFALAALNAAKRGGDRVLVSLAPTFAGARAATLPDITELST